MTLPSENPTRLRRLCLWIAASGISACGASTIDVPDNAIVSTSLCADSYLHAFPTLEPRLAALSWQSQSALSVTPDHLRGLPQADEDPERTYLWNGATRISSAGGAGDIELQWGENFDVVWDNLTVLSRALKASNPASELKERLQALTPPATRPRILYLDRSGATAGPGTFVDAVINAAGADNIIETPGWQSPDIETLMQFSPDIIVTSFLSSNYSGVNDRVFRHAVLAAKIESVPRIDIPGKFWPCAGPGLVSAAETLSNAISDL